MILVTLGTQDKKFYRLLDAIENQIKKGKIKDKVVVQAGCSCDYKSKKMEIFDLISMNELEKLVEECDFLITHGGVGSIISALKRNKKIIAVARLKKYGEHTNDHQLQIIENFTKAGYILSLDDFENLDKKIIELKKFKPKKYKSNTKKFQKIVKKEIEKPRNFKF